MDMLIGSDFCEFVTGEIIRGQWPCVSQDKIGMGSLRTSWDDGTTKINSESRNYTHPKGRRHNRELHTTLRSLWELESLGIINDPRVRSIC